MSRTLSSLIFLIMSLLNSCAQLQQCEHKGLNDDYLAKIACSEDFQILQGEPLSTNYSQVEAVKVVLDLKSNQLYFINTNLYKFHFDFCSSFLHYKKDLSTFNYYEYGNLASRNYILANLNHYKASDIYTLEFFSDDQLASYLITKIYERVQSNVYFKDKVYILNNANMQGKLSNIDSKYIISIDKIFENQYYQPMVNEVSYGYLQKVTKKDFNTFQFKKEDIILTDFVPNDIPFCQGIITTKFQTPLSHINVLSQNRKTPNCAYKFAWENAYINSLIGKLVKFEVLNDSLYLTEVSINEANTFWKKKYQKNIQYLSCNLKEMKLVDIKNIYFNQINTFGGKVANFGEMEKIILADNTKIPLPEAAFGIPFYYYKQHLTQNNIQKQIDFILKSDTIINNRVRLSYYLKVLQDSILTKPLNKDFYLLVINKLKQYPNYTEFRFRSSTNAEDIEGFTGAGLYTSKTGSLVDTSKSIDRAIKKVWASLWSMRAFEERMNANIDQKNLAMGILVHRAFGTEEANGVAITKDLYRANYPAFTINVQKGESSVVLPTNDETPEQFLIKFTYTITGSNEIALDYISHSSLNKQQPILSNEEINVLATYLTAIKNHFYIRLNKQDEIEDIDNFAMDIEFKLDKNTRKIYIKQARPY